MTVSSYINSISAVTEMSQVAVGALTPTSPFIQSWKANLQSIFRDSGGVVLLAQKILAKESLIYPWLTIGGSTPPEGGILVCAIMRQYYLSSTQFPIYWQDALRVEIDDLLKIIQDSGTDRPFIYKESSNVYMPEPNEESVVMYKHHYIQLVASLLNLYKDMLVGRGPISEKRKLQHLIIVLEKLPEETCKEKDCKVLKQVVLGVKKQIDADGVASERSMCSFRANPRIKMFLKNIQSADKNTLKRLVHGLSLDNFRTLVRHMPAWLPNIRLQRSIREGAVLLLFVQKAPVLFLKNISLNLLQKLLNVMLRDDIIYLLGMIPLGKIIYMLKDLPINQMQKILLEIPQRIVCRLKKELLVVFLSRKIEESLSQLKVAYQESLVPLNMQPKVVPSLRSLSVIKICQTSTRSVVTRGCSSLSLTYLNRIESLYPNLQKEVRDQVRIITHTPRVGDAVQFGVEESMREGYVPDFDLFSLASMVSGYDDCIKNILLEKCGNN